MVVSLVVQLFGHGSPAAITWLVVPIIVNSIQRQPFGLLSHISQKVGEAIPSIAHYYPSISVVFPISTCGAYSLPHCLPSFICGGLKRTVLSHARALKFFVETPATLDPSDFHRIWLNTDNGSTLALSIPKRCAAWGGSGIAQDGQPRKALSGQIAERFSRWMGLKNNGRFIVSHIGSLLANLIKPVREFALSFGLFILPQRQVLS